MVGGNKKEFINTTTALYMAQQHSAQGPRLAAPLRAISLSSREVSCLQWHMSPPFGVRFHRLVEFGVLQHLFPPRAFLTCHLLSIPLLASASAAGRVWGPLTSLSSSGVLPSKYYCCMAMLTSSPKTWNPALVCAAFLYFGGIGCLSSNVKGYHPTTKPPLPPRSI